MADTGFKASNLILCERLEIAQFMQVYFRYLQHNGEKLPALQIFNFNKIDRLDGFLERLEASKDFSTVRKVLILADVGPKLNSKEIAIIRAENQLNKHPNLDATYYLFPGLRTTKHWEFGYLEDALVKALRTETSEQADYFNLRNMAEEYLFSVANNRGKAAKFPNNSLHFLAAYFAGTEKYAGMRIAEAAANDAFDLNHCVFAPLRELLNKFLCGNEEI